MHSAKERGRLFNPVPPFFGCLPVVAAFAFLFTFRFVPEQIGTYQRFECVIADFAFIELVCHRAFLLFCIKTGADCSLPVRMGQEGAGVGVWQRFVEWMGYCIWCRGFAHYSCPDSFAVWAISNNSIAPGYIAADCSGGMQAGVVAVAWQTYRATRVCAFGGRGYPLLFIGCGRRFCGL